MSQSEVEKFMQECPQPMTIQTCLADLTSEVGELAKEVNVAYGWGRSTEFEPRVNLAVELGQVLFNVYQFAEKAGLNAEICLHCVIDDFRERYARQGHTGSTDYLEI